MHPSAGALAPDSCRVLVADHDRDAAALLQRLLERRGFVVRVAHSVALALDAAEEAPIDLLLSAMDLADGDGCDLLQQLHSKGPLHSIALSASDQAHQIRRCLDGGFQAFLSKPLASAPLFSTIQQLRGG